jgi:cold shock CspA family protein
MGRPRKQQSWNPRLSGRVEYVRKDQGYGRVRQADGKSYFFHASAVTDGSFRRLKSGAAVQFEPNIGDPNEPLVARLLVRDPAVLPSRPSPRQPNKQ